MFRITAIEDTHFEYYDDRAIIIFYEFACSNLNEYERTRAGKRKQTKTVKFEHCNDRIFLVSTNTITE